MAFYSSQCLVIINYSVLLSFWHTLEHISKGLNEEATNSGASVRFAGRSLFQPTASPLEFLVGKAICRSCLKPCALRTALPLPLSFYNFFFFLSLYRICYNIAGFMFWFLWDLSSSSRERTLTPCTARSFNHWTAREALAAFLSDAAMQGWTEALLRAACKVG